jgi:uncharacterized RDD family membrane protein YckC
MSSVPPPPPGPPGPPPGYQPPPPGQPGVPGHGVMPANAYASWGQRFAAYLLNALPGIAIYIVGFILAGILGLIADVLGGLMILVTVLAAVAATFYIYFLDGQSQSPGKAIMGIRVINEQTGQPIGGGMGIGRVFVHIVDSIPCYIGWLFPLWDAKRQTFADKILNTVVVPGPKAEFMDAYKKLIPTKG